MAIERVREAGAGVMAIGCGGRRATTRWPSEGWTDGSGRLRAYSLKKHIGALKT